MLVGSAAKGATDGSLIVPISIPAPIIELLVIKLESMGRSPLPPLIQNRA